MPPSVPGDPAVEAERRDLLGIVNEELDRLPAKYRCPIELCHILGLTYHQAAVQLDWPVATVKSRLTRGRLRLREGLSRRGLAPGVIVAAVALAGESRAAVPRSLVRSTILVAKSHPATVPVSVISLSEGVIKVMMWKKLQMLTLGVLVASGLADGGLSQQVPAPADKTAREVKAKNKVDDRRWVRSLPCGAIIEVVGVSYFPGGPDTWWRADGTPLRMAPCEASGNDISGEGGILKRIVVVRLARIPDGADHGWSIVEAGGGASGAAKKNGRPVPDLYESEALIPAGTESCTVRFKVASGPWNTIQNWGKNPGAVGRRDGNSCIFSEPIAVDGGTVLAVSHSIQGKSVRLVAVDKEDKEFSGKTRSGSGAANFQQMVVEFDLPPNRIKGFRLQTRSFEEVDIPRIALNRK